MTTQKLLFVRFMGANMRTSLFVVVIVQFAICSQALAGGFLHQSFLYGVGDATNISAAPPNSPVSGATFSTNYLLDNYTQFYKIGAAGPMVAGIINLSSDSVSEFEDNDTKRVNLSGGNVFSIYTYNPAGWGTYNLVKSISTYQQNPTPDQCDGYSGGDVSGYRIGEPIYSPAASRMAFIGSCLMSVAFIRNDLQIYDRKSGVQQFDFKNVDNVTWTSENTALGVHYSDWRYPNTHDTPGIYSVDLASGSKKLIYAVNTERSPATTWDRVLFTENGGHIIVISYGSYYKTTLTVLEISPVDGSVLKKHNLALPGCSKLSPSLQGTYGLSNDGGKLFISQIGCGDAPNSKPVTAIFNLSNDSVFWVDSNKIDDGVTAHYLPEQGVVIFVPFPGSSHKSSPLDVLNILTGETQSIPVKCKDLSLSVTVSTVIPLTPSSFGINSSCYAPNEDHFREHNLIGVEVN